MSYNKDLKIWSNNAPSANYKSIGEFFQAMMDQKPFDNVQINYDDGIKISRMEMKKLTETAAAYYQKAGLKAGDVIVYVSSNYSYVAPSIVGANLIGCPVNLLDYDMDIENFENLLMFLKPKIIFCETRCVDKIRSALKHDKLVSDLYLTDSETEQNGVKSIYKLFENPVKDGEFSYPNLGCANEALAFILCSSAATGPFKLIKISHQNVIDCQSPLCNGTMFSFVPSFVQLALSNLYNSFKPGACNIITKQESSYDVFVEVVKKYKINDFIVHPNFLNNLMLHPNLDSSILSSIDSIVTYGHPVSEAMELNITNLFKNSKVYNMYSLTECFGVVANSVPGSQKMINQLKIIPGLCAKIVDDKGNNLGPNTLGQLYIKYNNNNKIQGYYKNKKANDEAFDNNCWFNTGDLAMIDEDAFVTIMERKKNIISVGSVDIFPSDVERVVQEMVGVKDVVIVEYPNIAFGYVPAAAVVKCENSSLTEQEIQNYVKGKFEDLPEAHLLGGVYFVDKIPKTSGGQVQHFKVKETIMHMKRAC
jgi:acyl-CoA synthetase (AMP-forming)/AMP-acid ligase II